MLPDAARLNRLPQLIMTHLFRRAGALALAAVLAGCGRSAPTHDAGPLTRVVSVSKQINEFIYDVGAQDHLVAKDLTSVYPPEIRSLPSVGYHRALSAEGIISMNPSLFLTDGNVGPDAVLDQLRKVGIPITVLRPGHGMDSAQVLMLQVGELFHRQQAADSVVAAWRADMAAVRADSAKWSGQRRPRVLVMHFGQLINNYLAVSRGSPADSVVYWAGGVNAIDSIGGMTRLTPEMIARTAPDVIVATNVGYDRLGSAEAFSKLPGVALTPAGKNGRIYRVEESGIMYFTPRTPDVVRKFEGWLHP